MGEVGGARRLGSAGPAQPHSRTASAPARSPHGSVRRRRPAAPPLLLPLPAGRPHVPGRRRDGSGELRREQCLHPPGLRRAVERGARGGIGGPGGVRGAACGGSQRLFRGNGAAAGLCRVCASGTRCSARLPAIAPMSAIFDTPLPVFPSHSPTTAGGEQVHVPLPRQPVRRAGQEGGQPDCWCLPRLRSCCCVNHCCACFAAVLGAPLLASPSHSRPRSLCAPLLPTPHA